MAGILDHAKVAEDENFQRLMKAADERGEKPADLEIVGACPRCGCPIYGQRRWKAGEQPVCRNSCLCWARKALDDIKENK